MVLLVLEIQEWRVMEMLVVMEVVGVKVGHLRVGEDIFQEVLGVVEVVQEEILDQEESHLAEQITRVP